MYELYQQADKLVAEMKRLQNSGTNERKLMEYSNKILDYLEDKLRMT